jgi:deoxyribonuclease IV
VLLAVRSNEQKAADPAAALGPALDPNLPLAAVDLEATDVHLVRTRATGRTRLTYRCPVPVQAHRAPPAAAGTPPELELGPAEGSAQETVGAGAEGESLVGAGGASPGPIQPLECHVRAQRHGQCYCDDEVQGYHFDPSVSHPLTVSLEQVADPADDPLGSVRMKMTDELGAHVSTAGGCMNAPGRAAELGAVVLQLFTKQPNRWAERHVGQEEAEAFRVARARHGIRVCASHDSYLINLATPDPALFDRSRASFVAELDRAEALGLEYVVTHPGNATDGDRSRGISQNAAAIRDALDECPGSTRVLLEGTAGTGNSLGCTFEELALLLDPIADRHPERIGVCLDTCHLWAAGHDLNHLDDVLEHFDYAVGLPHLRLLHLNDSATPFHSRRDRHAHIGRGTIGDAPFHAIMNHPGLASVPKLIETPKDDDAVVADRGNLDRLRGYRALG